MITCRMYMGDPHIETTHFWVDEHWSPKHRGKRNLECVYLFSIVVFENLKLVSMLK